MEAVVSAAMIHEGKDLLSRDSISSRSIRLCRDYGENKLLSDPTDTISSAVKSVLSSLFPPVSPSAACVRLHKVQGLNVENFEASNSSLSFWSRCHFTIYTLWNNSLCGGREMCAQVILRQVYCLLSHMQNSRSILKERKKLDALRVSKKQACVCWCHDAVAGGVVSWQLRNILKKANCWRPLSLSSIICQYFISCQCWGLCDWFWCHFIGGVICGWLWQKARFSWKLHSRVWHFCVCTKLEISQTAIHNSQFCLICAMLKLKE